MKKITYFLVILTLLVMAMPAAAKSKERVGDRINLFIGPTEFPASEPFHIAHGWVEPSSVEAIGIFEFELEVDGVLRKADFVERSALEGEEADTLTRIWVHNFPDGMTGTHTFTGHWLAPCRAALDEGLYPGPCPKPNANVEVFRQTLLVA